ncbi:hypothetical protein H6F50_20630 [Coleofasciculus sp. FACHB-712]|uniref:hypothetical protein n=1 Tax=Coleofasciculus sp. FACHB-712 TaxID=2692789 RepID=UPI001686B9D6|nr:hypothetical protein [Coleofasciculus sp. FACHB-712]MBD1944734.1 hypothetical protein [Coleofasciculus sp. FACHB-712]
MEPVTLTAVATAIATLVATKALEKTTENLTDKVFEKSGKLLVLLKSKSPSTARDIELAPQQPLDYGQAVLELEAAAKDPEVTEAIWEVKAAANQDPNPKLAAEVEAVVNRLQSQPSIVNNFAKLAEEIKAEKGAMVAQSITIEQQTNHYI